MFKEGELHAYDRAAMEGYPWNLDDVGYHLANMGSVLALMQRPPGVVLDAGCGNGFTSRVLSQRGYAVTGIDVNPAMLEIAMKRGGADYYQQDYCNSIYQRQFDAVLFYDSLHHSKDIEAPLKMAFNALKWGGRCICVEPGIGHSLSPEAQLFANQYYIDEVSTPPSKIISVARKVGFSSFNVYPHAGLLNRTLYKRGSSFINKLRHSVMSLFLLKRYNGIVVLHKLEVDDE